MEIEEGDQRCGPKSFLIPKRKGCVFTTIKNTTMGFKIFDAVDVSLNLTMYSPYAKTMPAIEIHMGWDSWITLHLQTRNADVSQFSMFDQFFPINLILSEKELDTLFEVVTRQFSHVPALFFQLLNKSSKTIQVNQEIVWPSKSHGKCGSKVLRWTGTSLSMLS